MTITHDELHRLLHYDPDTGLFTRKVCRYTQRIGAVAGVTTKRGYVHVRANKRIYQAHRLAWLYMTGSFPEGTLDHIDGNCNNNRWANLRECTPSQNSCNIKVPATSKLGVKNVRLTKHGKYRVQLEKDGAIVFSKTFNDLETAEQAAIDNRNKYHGQFARHK